MLWKYRKSLPFFIPLMLSAGLQMAGVVIQWLGYSLIAIAILGAIYFVYSLKKEKRLGQEQASQTNLIVEHPQETSNILHIERQEPPNRPPKLLFLIGMLASFLLLTFAGFQTYLVLSDVIVAKFNLEWIVFYLLFGLLPLWLLLEPFTFDRKYYKSGRSATAIDVTFVVSGDITDVFNRCFNIIEMMKAKIIRKNTPNLIKARLNKANISIEVSLSDDNVKVYVVSDATWVTVKVGKGRNQRIIDEFQKHFIDEFRVSKPDNAEQSLSLIKHDVGKLLLDGKEILRDLEKMNAQLDSMGVVSAELKFEIWYKDVSKTLQTTDYEQLWFENKEGLDYREATKSDYIETCKHGLGRLEYIKQLMFDKEGSQSLGDGIQPKSYDKRDVIISSEPEISIDIDKCSVLSYGQSDQAIEVALTLKVKSPPINIADLQLYMGDEMLKLLSPAMPITQRNNKECYMTKYKLSLGTIYKVEKDSRDKYHIRVVTKRQEVDSEVFSINNP